jgi:hypothetical protein
VKSALLAVALVLLLAPALDARAQNKGERSGADAAAERARRDTGGRVLSVRPPPRHDNGDYRVKILTPEGEVRYLNVDPRQDAKGRK